MDEKSLTLISPRVDASEKILRLSGLTPSSLQIQSCNHISWTRATGFSRQLALTTSYRASATGLTTSLHASDAVEALDDLVNDLDEPPWSSAASLWQTQTLEETRGCAESCEMYRVFVYCFLIKKRDEVEE